MTIQDGPSTSPDSPASSTSTEATRRTTGEALIDGLVAHGVDTVFGIPGVQTYPLFDALGQASDKIRLIGARHEQACSYMALGYAQATGQPGVCSVVPGPGVLNASAALLTAMGCSTPIVCLTSEIPSDFLGRSLGHLHEMPDQRATIRSFTKWAKNILHPSSAPGLLDEAFFQALSGRPGPVTLAAPWDVMPRTAAVHPSQPKEVRRPLLDAQDVERAADLIRRAERPMIMVGGGAIHAADDIRRLSDVLQAPVVSFRRGRGIVSNDDPYGFTCAEGFEVWGQTDLLLAIGTRQELVWFRWPDRPENLTVINIDIDPMQHARLDPTIGIVADSTDAVHRLLELLGDQPRPSRRDELAQVKAKVGQDITRISPHVDYLSVIREVLPDEGYFVEEISQVGFASIYGFPVRRPRQYITAGCQGTLGFGFPTSLGVKAARPQAPVVSVTGDGGFLFGVQELATAVQFGLGVVTIVFDNSSFGNVKGDQERIYGRQVGVDLLNPDFVALARSFGADGYRAESPDQLRPVLDQALEADRPAVIHVPMPLDIETSPWAFLMPESRTSS